MSGICEIFPDDESCQVAPEPEEPVVDDVEPEEPEEGNGDDEAEGDEEGEETPEGDMEEKEMKEGAHWTEALTGMERWKTYYSFTKIAKHSDLQANLGMLMVPVIYVAYLGSQAFRYRTATGYYTVGELGASKTNFWELSDLVRFYGGLAIMGPLVLTQLLATLGIAVALNLKVWGLMGLVSIAVGTVLSWIRLIGYNSAWSTADDTAKSTAERTAAAAAVAAFESDFFDDAVVDAYLGVMLAASAPGFMKASWYALSLEEQETALMDAKEAAMANMIDWNTQLVEAREAAAAGEKAEDEEDAEGEEGDGEEEEGEEGAEDAEEGEEGEDDESQPE